MSDFEIKFSKLSINYIAKNGEIDFYLVTEIEQILILIIILINISVALESFSRLKSTQTEKILRKRK